MKRILTALGAVLLFANSGSAVVVPVPEPDLSVIVGDDIPLKLSAFRLFWPGSSEPLQTLTPYTLRTPLFSDYTEKHRMFWIPKGRKAEVSIEGIIEFPVGSIIVKSFGWPESNGGMPVETRLLVHREGGWIALPYIWDADGKDATLVLGGRRVPATFKTPDGDIYNIQYAVPNRNQCKECHNLRGKIVPIGPKARNFVLPDDSTPYWRGITFKNPAALKPILPQWDNPESASLQDRARAYLDVNCAHCHNSEGSASNSGLFLRWTDPVNVNYGIGKRPTAAGRGSGGMEFAIAPGEPDRSFLIYRLESTEPGIAMPELGRSTVHREGAALLRQWIAEMPKASH